MTRGTTERYGFILINDFALMSMASSVDPLRSANQMSGKQLYDYIFLSVGGGPVRASCGAWFETIALAAAPPDLDYLFIVAGGNPFALDIPDCTGFLRQAARRGVALGGISGGVVLLARAGLLDRRRIAVHWEYADSLRELAPDLLIEQRLFVLDRDRATCAGGVAGLDMMHALIRSQHGHALAASVSRRFIYTTIRTPEAAQRGSLVTEARVLPAVFAATRLMEDHIADPLPLEQLARLSGLSSRQLQRQFRRDLGVSVMDHYSAIRLDKADELLRQTRLPLGQVAYSTGYSSQSNFSRAFLRRFGTNPGERRNAATALR
ncbi:GlxA family transcriptional regulator [Paracoccus sp. IB05]|uniref:GlxA family transcriptional regulator n=1 Tax=Paracoccus sp. IB05 TaxID=2779367 RepID=UPI00351C68A7